MSGTWTPAGRVIANFARGVKEGKLQLHPQIGGAVGKMGAYQPKGKRK